MLRETTSPPKVLHILDEKVHYNDDEKLSQIGNILGHTLVVMVMDDCGETCTFGGKGGVRSWCGERQWRTASLLGEGGMQGENNRKGGRFSVSDCGESQVGEAGPG